MNRKDKAAQFLEEEYQINITGRNVQVTDSMKDYVMDKISKLEHLNNKQRVIDLLVTLDIQKIDHRCDVVMKVDNITIKSKAESTDMYVSIDQAFQKLKTQLLKYKTRIHNHQARKAAEVDMNVNVIEAHRDDDVLDFNDEIEEENVRGAIQRFKPHHVISKEKLPLKNLTLDESIMKMELSGNAFLVYRAEEDRKIKVIYRRSDGNYGIIEPEA